VNFDGVFFRAPFEDLTVEHWDRILDVNLKSQMLCAQAAAPLMRRNGGGHIINMSSLGGLLAWPGYTHYCVSKAGSIMLTRCLARALAPEILVNSVAPGTIEFPAEPPQQGTSGQISQKPELLTGRPIPLQSGQQTQQQIEQERIEEYIRRVPLHRAGTGDDIADTVAFLARSKFITGQTIPVDGGRTLV